LDIASITFFLFTVSSSLRVISYLPQMLRVALDRNGASAISYSTWVLWTCANLATALYATVNLGDMFLAGVSSVYAACCTIVIVLTLLKRRWHRTRTLSNHQLLPDQDWDPASELRATVHQAAVALAANGRPSWSFERNLATQARRMVWHDITMCLENFRRPSLRRHTLACFAQQRRPAGSDLPLIPDAGVDPEAFRVVSGAENMRAKPT
jgi:hypothetical protein